jgi:hypothetical protein
VATGFRPIAAVAAGALLLTIYARPAAQSAAATYLTYEDAKPVFDALSERPPARAVWPSWIAARDRETRARVGEGDATSVVHWLLFGTSFTKEPRITSRQLDSQEIGRLIDGRLADLERALGQPDDSERIQFARQVLGTGTPVRTRLLSMLDRVMKEGETHARLIDQAKALGDASLEFAERSRMYRARGLSTDTSLKVNFAIEEALKSLAAEPAPGSGRRRIQRVAIVGPGLDVSDRQEGYDFYAPQTIQPFALQDSLIRLGLALPDALDVTTFDVSPRVTLHVEHATVRARSGVPYTIHLPLEGDVPWTPAFAEYWRRFGETIGAAVPVTVPPGLGSLKLRAVGVNPPFVARLKTADVNITAQKLAMPDAERFDLIVGTNIFVYYDRLQQALATMSVASMLKPGGLLLSNNALVEVPGVGLRSIGYSKILYSTRDEDGDVIIWYQKRRG